MNSIELKDIIFIYILIYYFIFKIKTVDLSLIQQKKMAAAARRNF